MIIEKEKKKDAPVEKREWNGVKTDESVSDSGSVSRIRVDVDTTGYDKPEKYDFKAPEREEYKYDPDKGFLSAFKPGKPEYDRDREWRLQRMARVNAFGDLLKHLGAFAGRGDAPVEKRQENKEVLRAFADLDRMREEYGAKKERYGDRMLSLQLQDDASQRAQHDREYERRYGEAKSAYDVDWQNREALRRAKMEAYYKDNTIQETEQHDRTSQYKDGSQLKEEADRNGGRGEDENFYPYIQGVGKLKVDKSAQIQIGTRIKDAMLDAGLINEKSAAGVTAALNGSDSRTAFQSLLGYMRYPDVWDACKQFVGRGMELVDADREGYPTDNDRNARAGRPAASPEGRSSGSGFDYGSIKY